MFRPLRDQLTIVNSDASIAAAETAHLCLNHGEILTAQGPQPFQIETKPDDTLWRVF